MNCGTLSIRCAQRVRATDAHAIRGGSRKLSPLLFYCCRYCRYECCSQDVLDYHEQREHAIQVWQDARSSSIRCGRKAA